MIYPGMRMHALINTGHKRTLKIDNYMSAFLSTKIHLKILNTEILNLFLIIRRVPKDTGSVLV